jgi:hypothetical protein
MRNVSKNKINCYQSHYIFSVAGPTYLVILDTSLSVCHTFHGTISHLMDGSMKINVRTIPIITLLYERDVVIHI